MKRLYTRFKKEMIVDPETSKKYIIRNIEVMFLLYMLDHEDQLPLDTMHFFHQKLTTSITTVHKALKTLQIAGYIVWERPTYFSKRNDKYKVRVVSAVTEKGKAFVKRKLEEMN